MIDASTPTACTSSGNRISLSANAAAPAPYAAQEPGVEQRARAEDDRRDERDLVRLEDVRGHPGAVPDVVPDVVRDRRRVPRVVLGDADLHLADEIGADVGDLRVDAAADAHEQGDERAAEAEPDQHPRGVAAEHHEDDRRAEEAQPDGEHPRHRPRLKRRLERVLEAARRRVRGAHVAADGQVHADEAGAVAQHRRN